MDGTIHPRESSAGSGTKSCACGAHRHSTRLVVVTGGPGGGKTAMLELGASMRAIVERPPDRGRDLYLLVNRLLI